MADLSQLTERQREIYNFIRERIERRGYGPTVREIGDGFNIKSPNGVMCHLKALEKKGLIRRDPKHARAMELCDWRGPSQGLPLLGLVAAGTPILAVEQSEDRININELFEGLDHFVLQVRGNSMIEDHIETGDYVVIRQREVAGNGDRVVAMIDGEVTLKRFYKEADHIRLEPANGTMNPILVYPQSDVKILGVLIGVVRKC